MSYLFSRALVAEYSAANSLDGAPSAPSSGTPTPQAYLWRDKTTDAWKRFPSGMTFSPLTDDRGEALLKWYREDFLAPTSALPDEAQGLTDKQAPCGNTWRELSVRFDRNTSSWKTVQCLFDEDLPESSLTLPRWGMMRGGELWERTMSALPTGGTESGSWGTPVATGNMSRLIPALIKEAKRLHPRGFYSLATQVAADHATGNRMMWVTPRASDGMKNKLRALTTMHNCRSRLEDQLAQIHGSGGHVNPDWTEWLMGWPIGMTDLKPLATAKFQQWLRSHGVCLEGQSDET